MDAYDLHKFAATALPAPPALADIPVDALTDDQRRVITGWLGYLYLPTATTERMETQLRSVIERNSCSRPGAKTIPIVTAINGMGKSTMMFELCRQFYLEQIPAQRLIVGTLPTFNPQLGVHAAHIPIVWLNVGSADGKGDLDAAICRFFGLPIAGSKGACSARALHALRTHKVKIVVIDDAHLLRTHKVLGRQLLDHLKVLNTELGVLGATMIIVGADLESSDITDDPQIACRSTTFTMNKYEITTDEGRAAIQRILADLEQLLLPNIPGITPHLLSRVLAGPITGRVGGRHGDIIKLVVDACSDYILHATSPSLTADVIATTVITDRARAAQHRSQAAKTKRGRRAQEAVA